MNQLKIIMLATIMSLSLPAQAYVDADELQCLADNIYFEARDQNETGQIAVAVVTLNRVKSNSYPNTVCEVVWQQNKSKEGKLVAQFSWTLDGKSDEPAEVEVYMNIFTLANLLLHKDMYGELDFFDEHQASVLNYHKTTIKPDWDYSKIESVGVIGAHIFYRVL